MKLKTLVEQANAILKNYPEADVVIGLSHCVEKHASAFFTETAECGDLEPGWCTPDHPTDAAMIYCQVIDSDSE
jgi:hypothetical protein